jgi:hypothetical protein
MNPTFLKWNNIFFKIFLHIGPIHEHQTPRIILLREESNILKFLQANQFETSKFFYNHQNLNLNLETLQTQM